MSRTASMSVSECETAIGPRGNIAVTSENRGMVRKWLVANGVSSPAACGLTLSQLACIYNDTTDECLLSLCGQNKTASETAPLHANGNGNGEHKVKVSGNTRGAAIEALIEAIAEDSTGAVDVDAVNAIIDQRLESLPELIAQHVKVTRLEVAYNGVTRDLGTAPRHAQFVPLVQCIGANIPCALIGPAGSGKTTAAEQAFIAVGLKPYIQGAVSGAHELLGYKDAHGVYHSTPFRQAFEHGGGICLDEIDAGDPAALLVLNSALANGHMPFPDQTAPVRRHDDFRCVACANTFGLGADRIYVGRNQLDGATLDRFAKFDWNYDESLERLIVANAEWVARVQALRAAAAAEKARVIISPRASIHGARLLAAGMSQKEVEALTIWNGVDGDLRRRIQERAAS